ncbi:MAG: L-seryl-tRNA(Sec) selenium transferase [Kiritimatiellae bacterium]|nr:L-seryl-tRNA(Sec) selenium transferase [Kiritimatiellia bacterium]
MNAPDTSSPAVAALLKQPALAALKDRYGEDRVAFAVARCAGVTGARRDPGQILPEVKACLERIAGQSLKPVMNATGVILHTNLGRAPLGRAVTDAISRAARGYSNLEYDLAAAQRGSRSDHVTDMLCYITGAEDAVVVNNNAAGIILALHTLAREREVVVSRGELIEIGGSFRIPEIMAAGGVRMREIGATNSTRLADYEAAIGPETAAIFKAHKSNYAVEGAAAEVDAAALAGLAHRYELPLFYDMGSGLLRRPRGVPLETEPDVRSAIAAGADLVMFSTDKLLGGPQGGIVAGRAALVRQLARAPLMRALRVGKLTMAGLCAACRFYLDDCRQETVPPIFAMMERTGEELDRLARKLIAELRKYGVSACAVPSTGRSGGGSLPHLELPSTAVELLAPRKKISRKATFAEHVFATLLQKDPPVLGVLREGRVLFDVLTLFEEDFAYLAQTIGEVVGALKHSS